MIHAKNPRLRIVGRLVNPTLSPGFLVSTCQIPLLVPKSCDGSSSADVRSNTAELLQVRNTGVSKCLAERGRIEPTANKYCLAPILTLSVCELVTFPSVTGRLAGDHCKPPCASPYNAKPSASTLLRTPRPTPYPEYYYTSP